MSTGAIVLLVVAVVLIVTGLVLSRGDFRAWRQELATTRSRRRAAASRR